MAFIKLKNNPRHQAIPQDKAIAIWLVMTGEVPGTRRQKVFAENVERIYMNHRDKRVPRSYITEYLKKTGKPYQMPLLQGREYWWQAVHNS